MGRWGETWEVYRRWGGGAGKRACLCRSLWTPTGPDDADAFFVEQFGFWRGAPL